MIAASHTPGPWSVRKAAWRSSVNGASVISADGFVVVAMPRKADRPLDTKEADLSLIAAAPELLDALIKIVKYADSEPDGGEMVEMHRANVERARAAIAKAVQS